MTAPETDPQATSDNHADSSGKRRESRRNKFVAVGFFLFVILLWLTIHFINRVMTAEASVENRRARFVIVEITSGSGVADIARKPADADLISSELFFTVMAVARGSTRDLKAGEYRFETNMSLLETLSWLEQGRVLLHEFTIPEGYTVKHIARRLEERGLAESAELMRLAEDEDFLREMGIESPTLEGFLFPDTYRIAKGLSAEDLLRVMVDKMWAVWEAEINGAGKPEQWSLKDIMTIASIIEREAMFDDEKPIIASVIYNRLEKDIPLQCDVTIRYPLDNYGVHLTYADLEMDSPYNTYRHRGIPPTPICNPGLPSITAALNPAETDNLFFVSMNNGRHKFSSTLKEHNQAVHKYQILNERG